MKVKFLKTEYTSIQPGIRGGATHRQADIPVLSREEFDQMAAANPPGERYRCGTAAGYPSSGYWVVRSRQHPGYDALVEHTGHGGTRPVAYCPVQA